MFLIQSRLFRLFMVERWLVEDVSTTQRILISRVAPSNVGVPLANCILLPGSGTHSVVELTDSRNVLTRVARGLASQNICSWRYSKPIAPIESDVCLEYVTPTATIQKIIAQRNCKAPTFLLGYSLGGYLAPAVASKVRCFRGICMLNAHASEVSALLNQQLGHVKQQGLPSGANANKIIRAVYRDYIEQLDTMAPKRFISELVSLGFLNIRTTSDQQISAEENARLMAILPQDRSIMLQLEGLDHNFCGPKGAEISAMVQLVRAVKEWILQCTHSN